VGVDQRLQPQLAIAPENYFAESGLGGALYHQGQTDEAILHYNKSLRLRPDDPDALNNLATALADLGRNDEAIQSYQSYRFQFEIALF
jgi:Flp pilus assembly protein TadD